MWHSNLGKFRRVLVFDAERVCVSEGFGLLEEENKVSAESSRDNTSSLTKMYNFM